MTFSGTSERKRTYVATETAIPLSGEQSVGVKQSGNSEEGTISTVKQVCAIKVLIVDDHTLIREGLRQLFALEEYLHVVGDAADGFEAMEKIRQLVPDVVLLDIQLPIIDGIALTRQITQQFPDIAVIILTIHRQNQQIVEAMRNGARGYLLKSSSGREVAEAIKMVHEGGTVVSPLLTEAIVSELRRQPDQSNRQSISQLTGKELEIIRYLAMGMSNKEIAGHLSYSEKTVKNYLSIIFQKLHLRDRTQVAIFALRQGLLPAEAL